MRNTYLLTIDETGKHVRKLVICEKCVFFKRLSDDRLPKPYICMNPSGMIHTKPEGFCNYAVEKSRTEAEHD